MFVKTSISGFIMYQDKRRRALDLDLDLAIIYHDLEISLAPPPRPSCASCGNKTDPRVPRLPPLLLSHAPSPVGKVISIELTTLRPPERAWCTSFSAPSSSTWSPRDRKRGRKSERINQRAEDSLILPPALPPHSSPCPL